MQINLIYNITRGKMVDIGDCGKKSKQRLGHRPNSIGERKSITLPSRINTKWKKLFTDFLTKEKVMHKNTTCTVYIHDGSGYQIKFEQHCNRPAIFANCIANLYLLHINKGKRTLDNAGKLLAKKMSSIN